MKLISIDIETTGLNPSTCSVLEIGAVIFNPRPKKPGLAPKWETFETLVKHSRIQGDPWALQMNQEILAEICGAKKTHLNLVVAMQAITDLRDFIDRETVGSDEKLTITGKNFDAFDRQFLNRMPGYEIMAKTRLARRALDVGGLFFDPSDGEVVNLDRCLEKVGQSGLVTHRALDDALAVATAVTRFFA